MPPAIPVPSHGNAPLQDALRGQFGSPDVLSPASGARSPQPGLMSPPQPGVISPPPGVLSPGLHAMYADSVGEHLEQLALYRAPTSAGYVRWSVVCMAPDVLAPSRVALLLRVGAMCCIAACGCNVPQ